MLAITHLAVSLVLIHLLTLDKNDSFMALVFGVFIDLDHLFGLKDYVAAHGVGGVFDIDSLMHADGQWKSMFHNPIAAMVVGPVAAASRLAIPLIFWGVHMAMDYAEDTVMGVFSASEMLLQSGAFIALASLAFRKARMRDPELGPAEFLVRQARLLGTPFAKFRRAVSGSPGR